MYLLNEFNKIIIKKKLTDKEKSRKSLTVVGIGATGLASKYLINRGMTLNADKKAYKASTELYEKGKTATRTYHPDRLAGKSYDKELENIYKNKFIKGVQEKKLGKLGMEALEPYANRTYKDVIKSDVSNATKTIKSKLVKGASLLKANKGKAVLGLGALAAGAAINKLRKSRKDKGKLRGKYNK